MSVARLPIEVSGGKAGAADILQVKDALQQTEQAAQKASVQLAAYKRLLDDPKGAKGWSTNQRFAAESIKLGAKIIGDQITSAASAIAAPAKTTYDQALNKAYQYRDANQKIALSVGKSYESTGQQIMGTAQRLGLMPSRVMDYGRAVRHLTGDWQGAQDGLAGFQNRALKTDRTIEEMIPTAATLTQTFGIKSTEDVNKFFGTLDRQAKNAKVSAEVAERAFISAAGMMASITNAKPAAISAFTTGMIAGAPTAALGEERAAGIASFVDQHDRYLEGRMRKAGKLKKGERLRDEQGLIRGDKMFDAIEFMQEDLGRFYGTKNKAELVGRMGETGTMAPRIGAGLLNLNVAELRKQANVQATADDLISIQNASAAGKRAQSDVRKDIRDIGLGESLLGMQDKAVSMGGGAAGIAIGSAGQVFAQATSSFWNAVNIFANAVPKAAPVAAGVEAGGAVAGASAAVRGYGSRALGALGRLAGPLALLDMATWSGSEPERYNQPATAEENQSAIRQRIQMEESHLADVKKGGMGGWLSETFFGGGEKETQSRIDRLKGELEKTGGINATGADMIGAAVAKHMSTKTLRTQDMGSPQPQGQAPLP
jgi:hypothetical protein